MQTNIRTLNSYFNPRRFGLLLQRDLMSGYRTILIAMATIAAVVISLSVLTMLGDFQADLHYGFFYTLLFAGGFIITSLAFRDLHQNGRSYTYLTLPGSRLEKFAGKLIATSIGYSLFSLAFISLLSLAGEGINQLIFGRGHDLFNPLRREVWLAVAVYLVTQSIFLLGAAYFRRLAFIKTALAVNILAIVFAIGSGLVLYLVFRDYTEVGGKTSTEFRSYLNNLGYSGSFELELLPAGKAVCLGLKIAFWAVLAPLCWVISYLRLSEKEV